VSKKLPDGWVEANLGDLVLQKTKQGIPEDDEFIYIDIASVDNKKKMISETKKVAAKGAPSRARKHVIAGDILVSMTRPNLNAVAIVPHELNGAIASTGFDVLRPVETIPQFIFYHVKSHSFVEEMTALVQGALYPAVKSDEVRSYRLSVPPLNEQKRIVAKIEALQARSKAAREALAAVPNLGEQFKQSVLAAAFRGDLTKTWREQHPDVEPAEQLLARIRTERRTKWEADQLAAYEAKGKTPPKNWQSKYKVPEPVHATNLPEGWSKASLGEITSFVTSGSRGWAKYYSSDGSLFLRVGNLDRQTISLDLTDIQRVSPPPSAEGIRTRVQASDLLISITADLGMVAVIDDSLEESYVNQHVSLVRPVLPMMSNYLGWFVTNPCAQQDLGLLGKGVGKTGLGLDDIRELEISIPTYPEQVQIIKCIETLFAYADSILEQAKASLKELERLDQSILAKAFRGELVPQDPNDEPASVLLERIKAERKSAIPVKRSRKKP